MGATRKAARDTRRAYEDAKQETRLGYAAYLFHCRMHKLQPLKFTAWIARQDQPQQRTQQQ